MAACPKLNCGMTLVLPLGSEMTGFNFDAVTNIITIDGTDLDKNEYEVSFAELDCNVLSATETQIICELEQAPMSGDWMPIVYYKSQSIETASDVTKISINIKISSVYPNKDISPEGNVYITLTGTGFPTYGSQCNDM